MTKLIPWMPVGPEDNNPDGRGLNDNIVPPTTECQRPTGVELTHDNQNNDDESNGDDDGSDDANDNKDQNIDNNDDDDEARNDVPGVRENDTLNDGAEIPAEAGNDAPNATELDHRLEVPAEIAGVETDDQIAGVETDNRIAREMVDKKNGLRNHNNNINLRPWKQRSYDCLHAYPEGELSGEILLANIDYDSSLEILFLTEQMSLKRDLKAFGTAGADVVLKVMRQLDPMKTIIQRVVNKLSQEQRAKVLRYLMHLKDKRNSQMAELPALLLFTFNDDAEKVGSVDSDEFHRLTMKLLYLSKHIRVDLPTTVALLTTRVKQPDVDDWRMLSPCINTQNSTEAEMVGVDDGMVVIT
jgi:hypothetical protein